MYYLLFMDLHMMKKLFLILSLFLWFWFLAQVFSVSFQSDFVLPLLEWDKVYTSLSNIDTSQPFTESLKDIFYPPIWDSDGWAIWKIIRNIWVWLMVIMLIVTWWLFAINAWDAEKRLKLLKWLMFIMYGAAIFFGVTRLLWTVLNISDFSGIIEWEDSILNKAEQWIILQIIWFLKAFAFFVAIVLVTRYGFRIVLASWEEAKIDAAKKWILNVVIALVFIKVIDYLYYIAQTGDFQSKAVWTIVDVSKFFGFIFGAWIFLALLYIGFMYLTSAGNDERISKAKNVLKNMVIVMLVVFMFLLIVYQLFSEISL